MKPQYVDQIPRAIKGSVQSLLDKKNEMDNQVRKPVWRFFHGSVLGDHSKLQKPPVYLD